MHLTNLVNSIEANSCHAQWFFSSPPNVLIKPTFN